MANSNRLRRYGYRFVVEAGAVVSTKLTRQLLADSKKGKKNASVMRDIGLVVLTVKAAKYLSIEESKDLLTFLSTI